MDLKEYESALKETAAAAVELGKQQGAAEYEKRQDAKRAAREKRFADEIEKRKKKYENV